MGLIALEHMPLPAMMISKDRMIMDANSKAFELFENLELENDLTTIIRNPDVLDAFNDVKGTDKVKEGSFVKTGRRRRTFDATISGIPDEGAFIALYETTIASEAERMRSSFVADVSHELRSPLTSLIATIDTLKGGAGEKPDIRNRFLDLLDHETDRMHRIVNELLTLSATEAQEHILPDDKVNLTNIVSDVAKMLEEKAIKRQMTISTDIENNLPDTQGDFDELYQVIHNLVDNAIKYGARETDIIIKATLVDDRITVSVNNQGNPIPEQHIPLLTERFYRADKSRSREMGGTGLGLAIVKHIVNRHLGNINIESNETDGTTFTVCFPANIQ